MGSRGGAGGGGGGTTSPEIELAEGREALTNGLRQLIAFGMGRFTSTPTLIDDNTAVQVGTQITTPSGVQLNERLVRTVLAVEPGRYTINNFRVELPERFATTWAFDMQWRS